MEELKGLLEHNFIIGSFQVNIVQLIIAFFIITGARILLWVIGRFLNRYFKRQHVDAGRQYAFKQFIKYIVYTIAVLMALEAIGIQLSVIWGGAAALMVGIGLGLQQTFNDLISGLILLIEGSVEVGDIIKVDGLVGKVESINMRTSKIMTRDNVSILVPNSKLVGENAVNWSHAPTPSRFQVRVGVAYSSDVDLVTSLLLKAVNEHPKVLDTPAPGVQFIDFGSSSLDFDLHFYSHEYMGIEWIKSDVRYKITRLFREHKVEIPFPQQDLWLRNGEVLKG